MKKFLLGIILPVLTLVTLIGTGFATWYFDNSLTATQATASTTVTVEKYAQVGTVDATNKTGLSLNFDQTTTTDGLKLVNASKTEQIIEAKYTPQTGDTTLDTTVGATFTITLVLGADLAKYVDVDTNLDKGSGVKWTAGSVAGTYTLTFTNVTQATTVSISSADFKYHATGDSTTKFAEPKNVTDYTKMHSIVNNKTVTIKLDAKIEKPVA